GRGIAPLDSGSRAGAQGFGIGRPARIRTDRDLPGLRPARRGHRDLVDARYDVGASIRVEELGGRRLPTEGDLLRPLVAQLPHVSVDPLRGRTVFGGDEISFRVPTGDLHRLA